jgi:hypothetical protein
MREDKMNLETIYSVLNISVLPAWGLLAFAPRWSGTTRFVHVAFIPLAMGIAYAYFLGWAMFFGAGAEGTGMGTLEGVMHLFDSPVSTLAGWTHYLVFDLFVGAWIVRDCVKRGVSAYLRVPSLFFTLMLGPLGLFMYLIGRKLSGKGSWSLDGD